MGRRLTNKQDLQYVNQRKRGTRPADTKYVDRPAILLRKGQFATQASQANFVLYDGRLHDRNTLLVEADVKGFKRTKRSSHQLNELAKGLVDMNPALMTSPREVFFTAMIWQLMCASGATKIGTPDGWSQIMRTLLKHMPVAAILRAMTLAVRRDYDTEKRLNTEFWARHMPGRPPPKKPAQRKQLVADFVARRWQATARSAMTQVTTCNANAALFGIRRAPTLAVESEGGHLGIRPGRHLLTAAEILGI